MRKSTHINYHSIGFKARYYKGNEEVCFVVSLYSVLHLLSIPKADIHETRDRAFNSHDGMKNLVGIRRGIVWKRPVRVVERTIRDFGQTLKEIELGYVNT